jgi:hypothetical protein
LLQAAFFKIKLDPPQPTSVGVTLTKPQDVGERHDQIIFRNPLLQREGSRLSDLKFKPSRLISYGIANLLFAGGWIRFALAITYKSVASSSFET